MFKDHFPLSHAASDLQPRVFGCIAFVHVYDRDKFDPRALKCVLSAILLPRRDINALTPEQRSFSCQWMSPSLSLKPTLLLFRGRI